MEIKINVPDVSKNIEKHISSLEKLLAKNNSSSLGKEIRLLRKSIEDRGRNEPLKQRLGSIERLLGKMPKLISTRPKVINEVKVVQKDAPAKNDNRISSMERMVMKNTSSLAKEIGLLRKSIDRKEDTKVVEKKLSGIERLIGNIPKAVLSKDKRIVPYVT